MIITDPAAIEARSMEIIASELKTEIPAENRAVVMRVIHATADFDYAENLAFSEGAVAKALDALRAGCRIVTDTQMAKAGINKTAAAKLGCAVDCFMSDPDVAEEAKARGCTRAQVSMEKAARLGGSVIFVIGICCFLIGLVVLAWGIYSYIRGSVVPGWTSLLVSLWLIGGVVIMSLGCIGEYVGKIYVEVKHRPRYHIEKIV